MLEVVTGDGVVVSDGTIPISLLHKLLVHKHSSTVRNPWKASCWRHPKSTPSRGLQFLLHSIVLLSLETAMYILLQWSDYDVLLLYEEFDKKVCLTIRIKYLTCMSDSANISIVRLFWRMHLTFDDLARNICIARCTSVWLAVITFQIICWCKFQ